MTFLPKVELKEARTFLILAKFAHFVFTYICTLSTFDVCFAKWKHLGEAVFYIIKRALQYLQTLGDLEKALAFCTVCEVLKDKKQQYIYQPSSFCFRKLCFVFLEAQRIYLANGHTCMYVIEFHDFTRLLFSSYNVIMGNCRVGNTDYRREFVCLRFSVIIIIKCQMSIRSFLYWPQSCTFTHSKT